MKQVKYKQWDCTLQIGKYANGKAVFIQLNNHFEGPVARATVCLDGIPEGYVAIDTNNTGYEIVESLKDAEIIVGKPFGVLKSGFCEYPLYRLTDSAKALVK